MAEDTRPQPAADSRPGEDTPGAASGAADVSQPEARLVPPLDIGGVVLTKAQLLEALRLYIPNAADFGPLPDGQHFYILFSADRQRQPR